MISSESTPCQPANDAGNAEAGAAPEGLPKPVHAYFRFHAELNNFIAPSMRNRVFRHACSRDASVKHMIEAFGVPHTEVELILVDRVPVDFSHRVREGERVTVYPHLAAPALTNAPPLRPPAAEKRFIADAHLGQLARHLRMLGFDVLYRNDYSDAEIASIAVAQDRIVLTRDRDLLIRKNIVRGCYLHAVATEQQMTEVLRRFDLVKAVRALSRCLSCNGVLRTVEKSAVEHRVPEHSRLVYEHFYECSGCAQVYWEGSHVERMRNRVQRMLERAGGHS